MMTARVVVLVALVGCPDQKSALPPLTIEDFEGTAPDARNDMTDKDMAKALLGAAKAIALGLGKGGSWGPAINDPEVTVPRTDDYPYVGAIVRDDGAKGRRVLCTATALRSTVILTAAHCVYPKSGQLDRSAAPYYFVTGPNAYQDTLSYRITGPISPAHYSTTDAMDIGLLSLSPGLPAMAFPQLATKAPVLGQPVRKVGYGLWTDRTDVPVRKIGQKTKAKMTVTAFTANGVQYEYEPLDPAHGEICDGDSGGPALVFVGAQPFVLGVTHGSRNQRAECHEGGIDTLVPGQAAVSILSWLAQVP